MRFIPIKLISLVEKLQRSEFSDLAFEDISQIVAIRKRRLTYLSRAKLAEIVRTCHRIEDENIEGIFIEAGCALGGSTVLIADAKNKARKLYAYDVFSMIPPPSKEDGVDVHERYKVIKSGQSKGIKGDPYYGYHDDLYHLVLDNLSQFDLEAEQNNVTLVKGLLQDTLSVDEPVAFAHIDVDWYEPVLVSLERIVPRLSLGGTLILDDYNDWSGCREATDHYFSDKKTAFSFDDSAGSMAITRLK